jgi:phage terminase large subunit-like protein
MAWVAYAELHPESPVRFAGFGKDGSLLQGRPVGDPYIPLLANTKDQVEELAYGALMVVCAEGMDPELFDIGVDRIIRLGIDGEADGKAVPLAGAPNARDGARTTFQGFDETHRLYLPNHKAAVTTMKENLPKRPLDDPWQLSTTTAGEPGQGSVAEDEFFEAESIGRGEIREPTLFYLHRQADDGYDMADFEQRLKAVEQASGPDVAEWSDLHWIASNWDDPEGDRTYWERVWCNRWIAQESQAFNLADWKDCGPKNDEEPRRIPLKAHVTLGFDGARMRDSTAIVMTEIRTGFQQLAALWERPDNAQDDWEIDESEVREAVDGLFKNYRVHKMYADPPYWDNTIGEWAVKWPEQVVAWHTNKRTPMIAAISAFRDAITSEKLSHGGDLDLTRHVGNAGKHYLNNVVDEHGERRWILKKIHPDRKFDACMAAVLSWQARIDVLPDFKPKKRVIQRIR